jgi:ATP-dependent metalloprotease FtsH
MLFRKKKPTPSTKKTVEWSIFISEVPLHQVQQIELAEDLSSAIVREKKGVVHTVSIHPLLREYLIANLLEKKVAFRILPPPRLQWLSWMAVFPLISALTTMLLTLLMTVGMFRALDQQKKTISPAPPFQVWVPSTSSFPTPWIGSPEIFQECLESIHQVKGLLLEGEPGTGKTLLARHLAHVSNATLIPVVGSQFVEVFVGVGAQRVRQLFEMARQHAPSIVFIDELDAMATKRGYYTHSENDQTLNQLLSEMDGFVSHQHVLVLGASNRVSSMDPALLRPGRFDRIVHIPLPDESTRQHLWDHFLTTCGLPVSPFVDVSLLVALSPQFSGAMVERVVKEAVVFARREKALVLDADHLDRALEKERVGILKVQDDRSDAEKWRAAVHEAGHALVAHASDFRVRKISIRSNHQGMGGYTLYEDASEREITRNLLEQRLAVMMGGRAAETLYYGEGGVSTGAIHDISMANALAETMVAQLGFSHEFPTLGPRTLTLSETMRDKIHREIQKKVDRGLSDAVQLLNASWPLVDKVASYLLDHVAVNESVFLSLMTE